MDMAVYCKLPLQNEQGMSPLKISLEPVAISERKLHRNQPQSYTPIWERLYHDATSRIVWWNIRYVFCISFASN